MKALASSITVIMLFMSAAPALAADKFKEGDVVYAEWKANAWYRGKIASYDPTSGPGEVLWAIRAPRTAADRCRHHRRSGLCLCHL